MDKIEVSQRAREAASDLWEAKEGVVSINAANARLRRMDDLPTVQAFARFERDILANRADATPVATDVAALVEAATRLFEISGWSKRDTEICRTMRQALAPFTKGQP